MTTFNFSTEIVNKVKNNWITKEFKDRFTPCINDTQLCLTFVSLAYKGDMELGLAKQITDVMIAELNYNRNS